MFKHTKIVATIGPATSEETTLKDLMESGVSVFRLNFSHGDLENKALLIKRIRNVSKQLQQAVAILGDLQGPKIRVGLLKNGTMTLTPGAEVIITSQEILGEDNLIPTVYKNLPQDVQSGDPWMDQLLWALLQIRSLPGSSPSELCLGALGA